MFSDYYDNGKLVLFSTKDGTSHSERPVSSSFDSLAFSNSSKQLVIDGWRNGCRMFDLEKASLKEHNTKISNDLKQAEGMSLSFCPGDDKLLVGTASGECLLFDSKGSKLLNHSNKGTRIWANAFSPDGMIYAVGTEDLTDIHGPSTGQLIQSFKHASESIKFSKDGTRVYCNDPFRTKKIYGYDIISGDKLFERQITSASNPFALIGSDSQMIIGCGNIVRIVDTAVNLKVKELEDVNKDCFSAAMSNDGDIMAICEGRGISMHNSLGQRIQRFDGSCYSATFSAKGDKLAVGGDDTTVIYAVIKKKQEGSGFEFEERFIIDHTSEGEDGEGTPYIYQVVFFTENGKDRIVSVLSYGDSEQSKIVVHCAEEGGTRLYTDGITIPSEWPAVSMVEMVPNTSDLKVWNTKQHVVYHYADGKVDHKFSFHFQGEIKKASRFSPDGSKLLAVIGKQLRVYKFNAEKGFNARNVDVIAALELSQNDANQIEMSSHNGKNVVAIAFGSGAIDVIAFESDWKEGKALYTIVTNSSYLRSMVFRPNSSSDTCRLIVTCGYKYQSYEIRVSGINPTDPFFLLEKCDNEEVFIKQCAKSSNQKSIPFRRNEDGDTLLQKAFVKGYSKYVELAIKESPEAVLALYYIRPKLTESGEWKGDNSIIESFAKKNEIDQFKQILPSPELLTKFEPSREELINIVSCIGTLASYHATDALNTVLDVSANGCIPGLIPGRKVWFLETQNKYTSISTKIEDVFKFLGTFRKQDSIKDSVSNQPPQEEVLLSVESQNDEEKLPLASVSTIPPQNSALIQNLQFMGHEDDKQERIQLNMCRVLLPNLASSEVLGALLDMKEQHQGDSSSLKLFGKRSLRDSINAIWESWGKMMLFRQFLLYFAWLLSITVLAGIRRVNDISATIDGVRICLICSVSVGCFYFTYLEARQAMYEARGISQYFSLSWNLQQLIGLISTFLFVLMELVRPMGDVAIVCGALSQLFGWVNLLYYMRGIEEVAWVVYALLRVIRSMTKFFSILFLVVFSFTLFFWSLELPGQFERLDDVFLKTLLTSFFSEFDPDELINSRFKTFTLLFNLLVLLMIPLICLNAMIAFVGETFADILDDKNAVIAREKANLIMDMYCCMRENRRKDLEEKNVWTFKLELQSTLDKIDGSVPDGEVANKRATKGDIADLSANLKSEITKETVNKLKASTKEMKGKMEEMKGMMEEINTEMKGKMEDMKTETKEMRAEMTLMLQLLQQQQPT
uniref:Ion transport domain-containing protein n=1 Tax=Chaetoceros debilis TaxID=122233 RepID=A0A7S3QG72_9STRA